MSVPMRQSVMVGAYVSKQKLLRRARYPLVLMLEPLYRCNLECAGCGKIQQPEPVLSLRLSPERCWAAAEECGAPVVSIAGGEPLIHPEIDRVVGGLVKRRKFVYLCTNAILLEKKLDLFRPSPYLTFSIHVDGLRERHDAMVCREGVFDKAVAAIRLLKERGFRVTTNTTLFLGEESAKVAELFDFLMDLGVDGMIVSPGYAYEKAPDQQHFLRREQTRELFRGIFRHQRRKWRFNESPAFLDFLVGNREYHCTPWGNPTYSVLGWQRPCYLLGDGYVATFKELMETTPWENYGTGRHERCAQCMVHSGYEASAVIDMTSHPLEAVRVARSLAHAGT